MVLSDQIATFFQFALQSHALVKCPSFNDKNVSFGRISIDSVYQSDGAIPFSNVQCVGYVIFHNLS